MSSIRIVHVAGAEVVSVVDEATGLAEVVEVEAVDEKAAIDTIVEDEPDVSGRYLYTP
jgi:Ethanolamine utilization protein EutJ (predicted chaperonin)